MASCTVRSSKFAVSKTPCPRVMRVALPSVKVSRSARLAVVAESRNNDNSFLTGFVLGGVVFGALGFAFAPQISKALLGDENARLPKFTEDDTPKDPEQIKEDLIQKIAQLNASIDQVSTQLKSKDETKVEIA